MDLSSYYLLLSLIACTCTLSTSQAVTCDPLPTAVSASTTNCQVFHSQCLYTCNTGYEISNGVYSVTTTCQSNGQWNPDVIICNAVTCDTLPTATNADSTTCTANQVYNTQCQYTCNTGYEITNGVNSVTTRCQSNGQWDPNVIVCNAVTCDTLPTATNADSTTCTANQEYNSQCQYTCNTGYEITDGVNSVTTRCQSNGQWDPNVIVCNVVTCHTLPTAINADSTTCTANQEYNSQCQYTCNTGYEITNGVNSVTTRCQSNGQWDPNVIVCNAVSCSPLTDPTNGNVYCSNGNTYNSVCIFTCEEGYEGSGTASRSCQANKMWSESDFTCTACTGNTYGEECSQMCTCIPGAQCNYVDGNCTCDKQFEGMVCDTSKVTVKIVQESPYIITNATDLTLQCNVNLPSDYVRMRWTLDGTDLDHRAVPDDGILNLNLNSTSMEPERYSGVYACVAASGEGTLAMTVSTSISVDVRVPATITEAPDWANLTLGENAEFRCIGHGKPLPTITWHNGTGELTHDGTNIKIEETFEDMWTKASMLTILSLERSDNGSYFCQVENEYPVVTSSFDLVVFEKPDSVVILSFTASNSEHIKIKWEVTFTGNLDIDSCKIEYSRKTNESWTDWMFYMTVHNDGPIYMLTLEGLQPYTFYKARVSCSNALGSSEPTESRTERTKITSPDPPTNVVAEALSESTLRVTWTAPRVTRGVLSAYKVYYKKETDDMKEELQTHGTNTSFLIDGLDAYTVYNIEVTAMNTEENGTDTTESSPSEITSRRTLEGVPSRPNIVTFVNRSSSALELLWKPPSVLNGITTRYELGLIKFDKAGNPGVEVQSHTFNDVENPEVVLTDYSHPFISLIPDTKYMAKVIACNSLHCGGEDTKIAFTSHGKPSPPRNVRLCEDSGLDSLNCNVCWQEPEDTSGIITYYKLEYSIHKQTLGGFDSAEEDNGEWQTSGTSSNYSVSKATLRPFSDYQIKVRAATYAAESDQSTDTVSCRTPPNEPPSIAPPQTVDDEGPRAPTHTGFWMQLEEASSRNGPIRCYEVVVFQLEFDAETNSLVRYTDEDPDDVFPVADVVDYGTANGKPGTAYVAVKLNGYDFKEYIQVGSESRTSCQGSDESSRKRRDTVVFDDSVYNGELEPETVYQAFVRAYVDNPNGGEPYYKSSPFIEPVRTTSAPPTAAIAAISVVVIILIIAIIILTVLLVRRMKKRNESRHGSNRSGMRMRSFSQMGKMNNGFNVQAEETVHSYPAIPNESLPQVYAEKHANDNALFKEEYDDLPRSSRPVTVEASNKPENKPKNRYINIHAYDQSRVKLSILDDDEDTDYINACYVDGYKTSDKFIAAQGPKEDTVDDFWRMVWEKKTLTIVMVTKCSENGREKCAQYWPDSGTEEYGEIEVTFEEVTALADYHIRIFSVCHLSDENEKRKITQLHYTSWPDFGVPGSPIGMLNFIKRARVINPARAGPMVVHCSAGVGRTGTFIVLDAMMDMMAAEGKADVFGFVSKIRGQRNHLVQADVQYVFIHQALAEHHLYGNTEIDVGNLLIHWQKLSKKLPNSDVTGLEDEYNKLINTAVENVVIAEANEDANRSKNRVANTVPYEANRFKLIRLIGKEHSDYVNASSIDGYRQKGAYIAAQSPLPNTLEDFWRLIWESRTGSIVMLTNLVERGQPKCELYWPQEEKEDEDEEQPTMYGNFAVIKKKEEDYTAYTIQEFFVTDTKGGETRTIRHFHYTEWPEVGAPERGTGLIEMMGQIQKQQQQTGNKPILVHCSTGGGRTGVFCVLSTVIERIKAEGIVDIFQTYKVLRQQRPNIIQSIDQYHFVYRAVMDYLDSFDSYDNFK